MRGILGRFHWFMRMFGGGTYILGPGAILLLTSVILTRTAWSAERHVYCDSNAAGGGDGTIDSPLNALVQIPWTTLAGWVTTGDSVSILLKRGSIFRETLAMGVGGTKEKPMVISDYGDGPPPKIYGDKAYLGWKPAQSASGAIWETADSFGASTLWTNDIVQFKGTNVNSLRLGEWISVAGALFYRCDAGSPDRLGLEVRGAVRPYSLVISVSFLKFKNLVLGYTRNQSVRITGGEEINFESCTFVAAPENVWVGNASVTFQTCRIINGQVTVNHPSAKVLILYCLLQHDPEYQYIRGLNVLGASSIICLNSTFVGGNRNQVFNSGLGSLGFTNCIFTAHGSDLDANGDPTIQSISGTCVIDYCSALPSGRSVSFLKGVTLGRSNVFLGPQFRRYARNGFIMPMIDDYANRYAWDVVCEKANLYGYKTTLAVNQTPFLDSQGKALIRKRIVEGHGIVPHTRSHAELGTPLAFTLRYVGSGGSCSLSVTGNRLKTFVENDANGDSVDVDLGKFDLDPAGPSDALIKFLDTHPAYECFSGRHPIVNYNHRVPLQFLSSVQFSDIKAVAGPVFYDTNSWYRYEIVGSKSDLESEFPEGGELLGFVYPSSGYRDISELKAMGYPIQLAAGYRYGRTVNNVGNWVRTRMKYYEASIGKSLVPPICELQFESNCNDTLSGRNFTGSNLSYVASGATTGAKAAWFNGSSSIVTRSEDPAWDYSWRDWMFRAQIRPQTLDREQTIWFHGADPNNYIRVFLPEGGSLAFEVIEEGATRLLLRSRPGSLSTSETQSIAVQQTHDRWTLWINHEIAAAATNLFTIRVQRGPLHLGFSPSATFGSTEKHYAGSMDDVFWAVLGYAQTAAIADTVAFSGGALAIYGHNETYVPSELWRLAFQAWSESETGVGVTNLNGALLQLSETGIYTPEGYYFSLSPWGTNDFRLRASSPCVDAADATALLGYPKLRDLAGNLITDDAGGLLVSQLDMGAYESGFDYGPRLTITRLPGGMIRIRVPVASGISNTLEAALDGFEWLPLETSTTEKDGFYEYYRSIQLNSRSFYRVRFQRMNP